MQQYDLYQQQQIEVGDRVFYCSESGPMPIGTVREKTVCLDRIEYVVKFDDRYILSHVWERLEGKRWLQLYTREKYNHFNQGRPETVNNSAKWFSFYRS